MEKLNTKDYVDLYRIYKRKMGHNKAIIAIKRDFGVNTAKTVEDFLSKK
tara:strand:- start:155 stop:301 length:147 start_codon:yes stop_codon:yes gene_type:complete